MIESLPPSADPYPAAKNAVAAHENHRFSDASWRKARAKGWTVQQIVEMTIIGAKDGGYEWADEVKTADFRRFVAAKLGLM